VVSRNVSVADISARVKELVGELLVMDPTDIRDDDRLLDLDMEEESLGLDSLDSLQLALALAKEYEIYEKVEIEWDRVATVQDLALFVSEVLAARESVS
jgi:acyl carrier protein